MAPKKITGYVKLQITGGKATLTPEVGARGMGGGFHLRGQ